jgi:hypothetical protein
LCGAGDHSLPEDRAGCHRFAFMTLRQTALMAARL